MGQVAVILMCLFVAFGGFLFGYDIGSISGIIIMPSFINDFGTGDDGHKEISASSQSLIVSMLSLGTFFGALLSGLFADKFGRKYAIVWSTVVFCVGVATQTGAISVPVLVIGRVLSGAGVGLLSMLVPLYQSEAAPKRIRGTLVSCYQLAITIGIVVAFAVNVGTQFMTDRSAYRIPIGIQLVWGGFLGIGMIFLPDSPRGLLRVGRVEDAEIALGRMRAADPKSPEVQDELREIQDGLDFEAQLGGVTWSEMLSPNMIHRTMIGIVIQAFQQLTGINFIFYYGGVFFQLVGIANPLTVQAITGVVNVISTLPGMYLVEKIGRRGILLSGAIIMCISQFIVAIVGDADPNSPAAGMCLIVFTCIFIFGFAYSWGPTAWVISGEIYPLRLRGKGMSLATASNWLFNFILSLITPYLVSPQYANLKTNVGFIWGGFTLVGLVWVYLSVPETKGLSLEEVDEMFEARVPPQKSVGWVPRGRAGNAANLEVKDKEVV